MFYHILWWSSIWLYVVWFNADFRLSLFAHKILRLSHLTYFLVLTLHKIIQIPLQMVSE